jgi:hypothetical protein
MGLLVYKIGDDKGKSLDKREKNTAGNLGVGLGVWVKVKSLILG